MQCGIEAEAAKLGVTVTTQGPQKFDPTLQRPILDSVVGRQAGRHPDRPHRRHRHAAAAGGGRRGRHQGRPRGHHDRGPVVRRLGRSPRTTIGGGKAAFDAIKQLNPDGGKVMVMSVDPGHLHHRPRAKGFEEPSRPTQVHVPRRPVLAQRPGHRGQPDQLRAAEGPRHRRRVRRQPVRRRGHRHRRAPGRQEATRSRSSASTPGPNQIKALQGGHRAGARRPAARPSSASTAWTWPSPRSTAAR